MCEAHLFWKREPGVPVLLCVLPSLTHNHFFRSSASMLCCWSMWVETERSAKHLLHGMHMIPPWWLPLIGISYNFFIVDILELISLRLASLDVTIRDTQKLGCCKKEKGTSQDTFVARLHIIQFLRAELQSSHCGRRKRRALRLYCVRASEGEWRIKQEYISSYMENIPNKNQDLVRLKNEGGRRNLHNG